MTLKCILLWYCSWVLHKCYCIIDGLCFCDCILSVSFCALHCWIVGPALLLVWTCTIALGGCIVVGLNLYYCIILYRWVPSRRVGVRPITQWRFNHGPALLAERALLVREEYVHFHKLCISTLSYAHYEYVYLINLLIFASIPITVLYWKLWKLYP